LAEPVPLPSAPLRENQGHETARFAAAQPRVGQPGLIWTIMKTDTVTRVLGILSAIVFRFAVVRNFYKDIAKKVGYTSSCYIVNWGTKCQRIEEQA
jgi:hypothetical protein